MYLYPLRYSLARQPITQHNLLASRASPWAHYLRSYIIVSRVYTRSFTQVFSSQQWSYAYAEQFRRTILLHWNRGAITLNMSLRIPHDYLLSLETTTLCIELQVTQSRPCLFKQLQLLILQFISSRVSAYAGMPSRQQLAMTKVQLWLRWRWWLRHQGGNATTIAVTRVSKTCSQYLHHKMTSHYSRMSLCDCDRKATTLDSGCPPTIVCDSNDELREIQLTCFTSSTSSA